MELHGFCCGDQVVGELLLSKLKKGETQDLIKFCQSAEFFQDIPFSLPGCYHILKKHFPRAKFILTLRESANHWYDSLLTYHQKVFGSPLTKELLSEAKYRYKGFAWEANRLLFSSPESDPYKKENLISDYESHRKSVETVFEGMNNLLVLKIEDSNAIEKLSAFLEIEPSVKRMPWLNKTKDI